MSRIFFQTTAQKKVWVLPHSPYGFWQKNWTSNGSTGALLCQDRGQAKHRGVIHLRIMPQDDGTVVKNDGVINNHL